MIEISSLNGLCVGSVQTSRGLQFIVTAQTCPDLSMLPLHADPVDADLLHKCGTSPKSRLQEAV